MMSNLVIFCKKIFPQTIPWVNKRHLKNVGKFYWNQVYKAQKYYIVHRIDKFLIFINFTNCGMFVIQRDRLLPHLGIVFSLKNIRLHISCQSVDFVVLKCFIIFLIPPHSPHFCITCQLMQPVKFRENYESATGYPILITGKYERRSTTKALFMSPHCLTNMQKNKRIYMCTMFVKDQ